MGIGARTPSSGGTSFEFDIDFTSKHIVITSGAGNQFEYRLQAIMDLYNWLKINNQGLWVELGTKNENEVPNTGTVEEWARSRNNPVGGFYGITQGNKGRFASFIPPILELMGLVELEHNAQNNRVRAL